MQLFPQATNSAKSFGNDPNSAYANNQSESAKGQQQLQQGLQAIAQIIAYFI